MESKCLRPKGLSTGRQKSKSENLTVQKSRRKDFGVLDLSGEHDLSFDIFVSGASKSSSSDNDGTVQYDLSAYSSLECCPVCLRTTVSMARHLECCGPKNGVIAERLLVLCKLHQVYLQKRKSMGFPVNFHEMEPFDVAKWKKTTSKKLPKSGRSKLKPPLFSSSQEEKEDIVQQKIELILADSSDIEYFEADNSYSTNTYEFPLWLRSGGEISLLDNYYVSDLAPFIQAPVPSAAENELPLQNNENTESAYSPDCLSPDHISIKLASEDGASSSEEHRKRKLSASEDQEECDYSVKRNKSIDLNITESLSLGESEEGDITNKIENPVNLFVESLSLSKDTVEPSKSSEVPLTERDSTLDIHCAKTLSPKDIEIVEMSDYQLVESSPFKGKSGMQSYLQFSESLVSTKDTSKSISDFQFAKSLFSSNNAHNSGSLNSHFVDSSEGKSLELSHLRCSDSLSLSNDTKKQKSSPDKIQLTKLLHLIEDAEKDCHSSESLSSPKSLVDKSPGDESAKFKTLPVESAAKVIPSDDLEIVSTSKDIRVLCLPERNNEPMVIELSDDELDMFDASPIRPKNTDYPTLKESTPYERKSPKKLSSPTKAKYLDSDFWMNSLNDNHLDQTNEYKESVLEENDKLSHDSVILCGSSDSDDFPEKPLVKEIVTEANSQDVSHSDNTILFCKSYGDLNEEELKESILEENKKSDESVIMCDSSDSDYNPEKPCVQTVVTEDKRQVIPQLNNTDSKAYEDMDDDEFKEALSKYGLKKSLGRRKGIILLNYIKEQLNKLESDIPIQSDNAMLSDTLVNDQEHSVADLYESVIHPDDEEFLRGGQLDVLTEYIKSNCELHTSLLKFKPVWLDEFQNLLASKNITISKTKLKKYSDYLGIIYREKQKT